MNLWSGLSNLFSAERNIDGSIFYEIGHQKMSYDGYNNLSVSKQNPLIVGFLDLLGLSLGQTNFYIGDIKNPTPDKLVDLINDPNYNQSKQDFFKEYVYQRVANGAVFQAPIGVSGYENRIDQVDSIFNLNVRKVKFDKDNFQTKLLTREQTKEQQAKFKYSLNGKEQNFTLDEVIPFFDMANGIDEDFLLSCPSKMDSVLMPAVNMIKAFEAQGVIIKSNGREMFFSERPAKEMTGISRPISPEDKQEIQRKNSTYGMQRGQNRSMYLNGETGWKSLHIPMKDLGIQETMETTAIAMAMAFNVPRSLMPVFDNPKFENLKEAEIKLIQSIVEPMAADICNSYNSFFSYEGEKKLKYSLDHLAPMQHIEQIKVNKFSSIAMAYRNLQAAGFTPEQSQELAQSMGVTFGDDE